MANVLTAVWFVIAYVVAQTALVIWASLLFPRRAETARKQIETHPYQCFFLGALVFSVTLLFVTVVLQQGKAAPVQLLGWMLAGPGLAASVLGSTGFASLVADRLRSRAKVQGEFVPLLGGALLSTLSGLVPIVGWFLFAPVVAFMAFGAGTVALCRRDRKPAVNEVWLPLQSPAPTIPSTVLVSETSHGSLVEPAA